MLRKRVGNCMGIRSRDCSIVIIEGALSFLVSFFAVLLTVR